MGILPPSGSGLEFCILARSDLEWNPEEPMSAFTGSTCLRSSLACLLLLGASRGDFAETAERPTARILLVRHGRAAGDAFATPAPPVHGFLAEPLGVQQAQATADALRKTRIDVAFSSPYGRALQTAEIVLAGRPVPLHVLPALREWMPNRDLDKLPPDTRERIQREVEDLYAEETWKTELGEGTYEMYARIVPPFLAELEKLGIHSRMGGFVIDERARGLSVAVFAHGGTLNVLLSQLLGLRPFPVRAFAFEETGLAVVELAEQHGVAHPQLVIRAPHDVGR
jgi:broad specificity phosphatase PhoE